jgi:hypothetical protein
LSHGKWNEASRLDKGTRIRPGFKSCALTPSCATSSPELAPPLRRIEADAFKFELSDGDLAKAVDMTRPSINPIVDRIVVGANERSDLLGEESMLFCAAT